MEPVVTILMPVYNAERYLKEALESILNQTFRDFEFLIFNDGSTDGSKALIQSYSDQRIKFIDSPENFGYVKHLNEGIQMAKGKYLVRMDADDIAERSRLQKQVQLMESRPELVLCGSWMKFIGSEEILKYPVEHQQIADTFLIENPLAHSAIITRSKVLKENNLTYDVSFMPAEDYKLWHDLGRYGLYYNIPEVLLHYRRHEGQISERKKEVQLANMQRVKVEALLRGITKVTDQEKQLLISTNHADQIQVSFSINQLDQLLSTMLQSNLAARYYSQQAFNERILYFWKVNTDQKKELTFQAVQKLSFLKFLPWKMKIKYVLRYFVKNIIK